MLAMAGEYMVVIYTYSMVANAGDTGYAYRGLMRINYDHKWQIVVYKCYTGGKNWQYPAKIMQHGNRKTKKYFLNRQHQQ